MRILQADGTVNWPNTQLKKGPAFPPIPLNFLKPYGYGLFSGFRLWQDRNKRAVFQTLVKGHGTVNGCKDRVILAHAHAFGRPELGAALTHDDVAGDDSFAAIFLYAQTTPSGVATVAG